VSVIKDKVKPSYSPGNQGETEEKEKSKVVACKRKGASTNRSCSRGRDKTLRPRIDREKRRKGEVPERGGAVNKHQSWGPNGQCKFLDRGWGSERSEEVGINM